MGKKNKRGADKIREGFKKEISEARGKRLIDPSFATDIIITAKLVEKKNTPTEKSK